MSTAVRPLPHAHCCIPINRCVMGRCVVGRRVMGRRVVIGGSCCLLHGHFLTSTASHPSFPNSHCHTPMAAHCRMPSAGWISEILCRYLYRSCSYVYEGPQRLKL
ncbi:hypothetical protein C5167_003821 [Papaver somniferum]|uniref:Uncharacterized protein n=1 Tax=Papaver somniferum TaxID=3469 RepID=A0A4Y7L5M8_PAPSO|nr:hypothetical protein C5167_003821 [Papaver somniferum]